MHKHFVTQLNRSRQLQMSKQKLTVRLHKRGSTKRANRRMCNIREKCASKAGNTYVGTRRILQNKQKRCLAKSEQVLMLKNKIIYVESKWDPPYLFEEGKKHKIERKKSGGKLLIGFMLPLIKELENGCFSNQDHQEPKPSMAAVLYHLCGTVYSQFRTSLLRTVLILFDNDNVLFINVKLVKYCFEVWNRPDLSVFYTPPI